MSKFSKTSLGKKGESLIIEYLKNKGFEIISTNFRSKFGEIDIIGKINNTIVFFEVKTRTTLRFGKPYEAVNKNKIKKIKKTIDFFLLKNPKFQDFKLRIDVISLILDKQDRPIEIKHFENVL